MKSKFISELQARDELLNEPFLIQDVNYRTTKDNRPYLLCNLYDKSGQVGGVFWDLPPTVTNWLRSGKAVLLTGRVTTYKDGLQVSISDLNEWVNPDLADFLPTGTRPVTEMVTELRQQINSLQAPWQELVAHILLATDFLPLFSKAPAARTMHHAFVGGLLEHTLSMALIADLLAVHYPHVNRDLLLSGVLLHDCGKAIEYELSPGFAFSDDGRLVGHIVRAITFIEKAAQHLGNIPQESLRQLVHLVASHHGTLEWGSPVVPKTLEAVLLHQIDLLDSRVQGFFDHLNHDTGDGPWSQKMSLMLNSELRYPPGFKESNS